MEETNYITFIGKGYKINKPTDWMVKHLADDYIAFIGPKIGPLSVRFFIRRYEQFEGGIPALAEAYKDKQTGEKKFAVLKEQNIGNEHFQALFRHITWFKEEHEVMIFSKSIFTENKGDLFVLTSMIPNNDHLGKFDDIFTNIFNSFKFAS